MQIQLITALSRSVHESLWRANLAIKASTNAATARCRSRGMAAFSRCEKVGVLTSTTVASSDRCVTARLKIDPAVAHWQLYRYRQPDSVVGRTAGHRMTDIAKMAPVIQTRVQAFGQSDFAINARNSSAPKSDDNEPPSKLARNAVIPATGRKWGCSGVESGTGAPGLPHPKRYWYNTFISIR